MKSLMHGIFVGLGVFTVCSPLAVAEVHEIPKASPQASEPKIHIPKKPHVGASELHHFAAAIVAIHPIDEKAHQQLESKKLTMNERHHLLAHYGRKVIHILSHHHLTPVRYETLLTKAQTDPAFAQRTASVIKKMN
ncbi:MAG: DUF4168 domain-containing protein [Acidithiobacillus sp.]